MRWSGARDRDRQDQEGGGQKNHNRAPEQNADIPPRGPRSSVGQLSGGIPFGVVGDESSVRCNCGTVWGSASQAWKAATWQAVIAVAGGGGMNPDLEQVEGFA